MEITPLYIVSQIFACFGIISTILAYQQKKKKQILKFTIASGILYAIHYVLLNAWSGVVNNVVAAMRDYYIRRYGNKRILPLIVFVAIFIIMTFITFDSWKSLLPLCATVIYSIGVYTCNAQRLRIVAIICCLLWLAYNISVFSIIGMVSDTLVILSNVTAYLRFNKKTGRKLSRSQSH